MKRAWAAASVVGLAAILAMRLSTCSGAAVPSGTLANARVGFTPSPGGALVVRSSDRTFRRDLRVSVLVDGLAVPIEIGEEDGGVGAVSAVEIDGVRVPLRVGFAFDADAGVLTVALDTPAAAIGDHEIALALEAPELVEPVFASGTGALADLGTVEGRALVLEHERHALAVVGDLTARMEAGPRLVVSAKSLRAEGGRAELRLVLGDGDADVWARAFAALGEPTFAVAGRVAGGAGRPRVTGVTEGGAPRLRVRAGADGRFEVRAPGDAVRWYAGEDLAKTSPPVVHAPGAPGDVVLDLSDGGEVAVRVVDPDTRSPLTARLFVHGVAGTLDPSFGPDYRASGAGPIVDALRGEATTPLPSGRYRVSAMKGIEWSVDAAEIEVQPGKRVDLELHPRHVAPTPGWVACDLHVHARPSFDAPVTPEDRVLSLVAAGIDFAVPTEHNIVGDYRPSLAALDLGAELGSVPGVEITTYQPSFGHFGVFPYPLEAGVPPYKDTEIAKVIAVARGGDPRRFLQVHHPRMGRRIGYFDAVGWDRDASAPPRNARLDFDGVEVVNGYDLGAPEKIEQVLRDWMALLAAGRRLVATGSSDSHRIQYTWAGFPRTYVRAGAANADGATPDPADVVASLARGRAVVTDGPILELEVGGASPGDVAPLASGSTVTAHVLVRAAPWVDVTSVELVVGGKIAATLPVVSRPTQMGPEPGTLDEARARAVRLDETRALEVGHASTWVLAIARGRRRLDDALPFMPAVPLAFTNPVWVGER